MTPTATPSNSYRPRQILGLLLGPVLFFLTLFFLPLQGLEPTGRAVLASALWIATWWISEAIPIEATALLPLVIIPLSGGLDLATVGASYGHKMVFLYLGGFLIALAIERWNLHRRIALTIISWVGTQPAQLVGGFMLATAALSMWISNTATSLMMMPIGLAVVKEMQADNGGESTPFAKALMLGIAYSASIGGTATLIGTPPNLVFASVVKEIFDIEISFALWFVFGLPFAMVMLGICWWVLTRWVYRLSGQPNAAGKAIIQSQLRELGPMSAPERYVLAIFSVTALGWITRSFLLKPVIPAIDDTIIAFVGALALFLIPAPNHPGERLMTWKDTQKLPWGILLLFGGGLALAAGFKETDLAQWLGGQLDALEGLPIFLIILAITAMVNFLTEITSNLATASMMMPIVAALAVAMDAHPYGLMIGAVLAASCAFMLPVATPPNAVVFGSELLKMGDMIWAGFRLNLISIVVIVAFVTGLLPLIWGLDLDVLPTHFQLTP